MAYFSSGTEGLDYEARWCVRCVHAASETKTCAVLTAHGLYNYEGCNNPDSILHLLIPRSKDGLSNEQCRMFLLKVKDGGSDDAA